MYRKYIIRNLDPEFLGLLVVVHCCHRLSLVNLRNVQTLSEIYTFPIILRSRMLKTFKKFRNGEEK